MWVWSHLPPQTLLSVASAQRVGRLLVWVAPGFSNDVGTTSWLQELHAVAEKDGVSLAALGGDPSWARDPDVAARWSAEVAESGWFDRLHLDIEAYALPDWDSASVALVDGTIVAVGVAATTGLPVDVDVPYWFQSFSGSDGRNGLTAVCEVADSITVMAYQREASAIERVSGPAVDAGKRAGIPVWIGVNLRQPTTDAPSSSLWGEDAAMISRTLAAVAAMPDIAGVALHDADALISLEAGPR
jgi:hypothetical protein